MRIACIGWGSLVWMPGVLRCVGPWREDGPELPLEFARTSRDKRLTLVLTPGAGLAKTLWAELNYATAGDAQAALAGREGSPLHWIGLWPGITPRHSVGLTSIAAWAESTGLDAVVWAALPPKFDGVDGRAPANAAEAVAYLKGLDAETQARAREYVVRAPAILRTEFRVAFEQELGWLPQSQQTSA